MPDLASTELNFQYGNWLRAPFVASDQSRGTRRNGVEIMTTKALLSEEKEESKSNTRDESKQLAEKEKDKGLEEGSVSTSPFEKRSHKLLRDGIGRFKSKRKRLRGSIGDNIDENPSKTVRRRLMESVSPFKDGGVPRCCAKGKSGGLALLWKEGVKVSVQNYSKYHIDSLVSLDDGMMLWITVFYGQADSNLRKQLWDMLTRVKRMINEG
ncbi:hypothetical protein GOBAR_AA04758 [Gossypium barbadense]|uniref:Uncharacterized protein n=1 Tax=Gossypium barbadense TaxID=3634 RepID=A0A2P5YJQ1_GOSBA|nr:hypothetical protein GOBAR_AA04758 [Gossypium barbadense]